MSAPANETAYFWRLASNLQAALRCCGSGSCVEHCYDDLEGLAFTTENTAIRSRCEALLEAREVREITREPFVGDYDHYLPHSYAWWIQQDRPEMKNLVIACHHFA